MELKLTIDVQNYRLVTPTGQSAFLLQRPPIVEAWHRPDILVRKDGGSEKNAVSFKELNCLAAAGEVCHTTYVHGIMRQSDPEQGYQKGDQVWLYQEVLKIAMNRTIQDKIRVVNLRTWENLTVPLRRVLWVPSHRRLTHNGAEEELITLAGHALKRLSGKVYNLAVVQRVQRNELKVEIRELLQGETFAHDCQNLRHIPGGNAITEEICRRVLAIQEHMSLLAHAASTSSGTSSIETRARSSVGGRAVTVASTLATPPQSLHNSSSSSSSSSAEEGEEEKDEQAEFERSVQEMQDMIEARIRRTSRPIRRPHQKCNYPRGPCPTPATLFNRPEYTSELRAHYHVPDDRCALGATHELHCVYRSANDRRRDCLLGSNVRHDCCVRGPHGGSSNNNNNRRRLYRPPAIVAVPSSFAAFTIERDGRGAIRMVEGGGRGEAGADVEEAVEEFVDLPFETEPTVPDFTRDLDAMGDRDYGVEERTDLVGREWVLGRENVFGREDGTRMMMTTTWSPPGDGLGEMGTEQVAVSGVGADVDDDGVDAFADRHLDMNEYEEDGYGVDIFADRQVVVDQHGNGEYVAGNYFGGLVAQSYAPSVGPQFWGNGEQIELDAGWLTSGENWQAT